MHGKLKMRKMISLDILSLDINNDRIWYPAHGSAENRWQNDYINMHYEQKEKFEKKMN